MEQRHMDLRRKSATAQHAAVDVRQDMPDDEYDDIWPVRMSSSARRYQGLADVRTEVGRTSADVQSLASERTYQVYTGKKSAVPPRRSATQVDIPVVQGNSRRDIYTDETPHHSRRDIHTDDVPPRHSEQLRHREDGSGPRFHWMVFVGMAMFTMVVGWVVLTMFANWWQVTQDDWHYGRPRTYQVDMAVGHNDTDTNPSHFIALNLNRHIEVIEFPGGDASKARVYVGPTLVGNGQDLAVVTLTFKDVNGDGKLDMIVNVQDSHFVYINENGQFRPAKPGENIQL